MRLLKGLSALLLLGSSALHGITCSTAGTPGATLLLPYFFVARGDAQAGKDIPGGGADTLVSITNTGSTGIIVGATVWNKYGKPLFGFNIPMSGHDVAYFSVRDLLNGHFNVNTWLQSGTPNDEICGWNGTAHLPYTGFGQTTFVRFPNPDAYDAAHAVSIYPDPAFIFTQRMAIWESLDTSYGGSARVAPLRRAPRLDDDAHVLREVLGSGGLRRDVAVQLRGRRADAAGFEGRVSLPR